MKKTQMAVCAALTIGSMAHAQTSERVEVVGSNIKRINAETATPVTIVTKEEIDRTGATTVQELLRNFGVAGGQSFETQGAASFVTGASAIGLRGLSAGDTLILLNGRRIAPYGGAQQTGDGATAFVDLNSLPLASVQQIQILKDGASAIYGADAIAGVINVITRKEYTGLEVNARAGTYPGKNGGRETKAGLTTGFGNFSRDKYNVLLSLEAAKIDTIFYRDRSLSSTFDHRQQAPFLGDQRSAFSDYGNFSVNGGGFRAGTNCPTASVRSGACRYDFGAVEAGQPGSERFSTLMIGTAAVGSMTAFAELGVNRNQFTGATRAPALDTSTDFTQVDAARGLAIGTTSRLVAAALATQVPAGLLTTTTAPTSLHVRTRFTDFGPRIDDITSTSTRALTGLRGTVANWDWEVAAGQSTSKVDQVDGNEIRKDLLADLLVQGKVNVFSVNKTGYQSARYIGGSTSETKLQNVDAKISGEIGRLAGGSAQIALGSEFRKESITSSGDDLSSRGLKVGSAYTGTNGNRDVSSAFAEVVLPVTKQVEVTGAVRFDNYSDFGRTTNPKVAVGYRPERNILIRGSYSTAFKAPTLFQLYEAQAAGGYQDLEDPIRCAVTGALDDCDGKLIEVRSGGSIPNGVNLKPEESKNYNFGFVLEPYAGTTLSVDFWGIKKTNAITQFGAQQAIINQAPSVLRGPTVNGVPGSIIRVTTSYFNANRQDLAGTDFEINNRVKIGAGTLSTRIAMTHLRRFDQFSDGCEPCSYVGNYDGPGANPKRKGTIGATWIQGPWTVAGQMNYLGAFAFVPGYPAAGASIDQPAVASYQTTDAQVAYTGIRDVLLRFGIRNLTDRGPRPMAYFGSGTDTSLYDPRGRFAYVSAAYKFK